MLGPEILNTSPGRRWSLYYVVGNLSPVLSQKRILFPCSSFRYDWTSNKIFVKFFWTIPLSPQDSCKVHVPTSMFSVMMCIFIMPLVFHSYRMWGLWTPSFHTSDPGFRRLKGLKTPPKTKVWLEDFGRQEVDKRSVYGWFWMIFWNFPHWPY